MKKINCFLVIAVSAVFAASLSSCVNEEYDVEEINTEVTLGAEGLTLPLGTTKQLTLKNLLSGMNEDILQVLDGGAYAFRINDSLSLGDQLPDMDMLEIPDVTFEQDVTFSLSGIDEESLSIDGQEFEYEFELADEGLVPEVSLPEIKLEEYDPMGIWEYGKSAQNMEIEVDDVHIMADGLFSLPEGLSASGSADFSLGDLPEAVMEPETVDVVVRSEAPEGISNISDIKMTETSGINVILSVENLFLTKGNIVPDMVLDLGGLLVLEGGKGDVVIDDAYTLNEENDYTFTKSYGIEEVGISPEDWDGSVLELKKVLEVTGKVALESAMTNADKLASVSGDLGLRIDVEFVDFAIGSLMMDVDEMAVTEEMEIPVSLDDMTLPEGVKSIDRVIFAEDSYIDLAIALQNISGIKGLNTVLKTLEMTFPEEMKVKEAVDGKVTLTEVDLSEGLDEKIHIEEISFPAPVDGKLSYSADVTVKAEMTAGGRICSADVPVTEDKDGAFIVKAQSHFKMDDYEVQIEGLEHKLEIEPQVFEYELPEGISDIGTFSVIPEGTPVLAVELGLPETALAVQTGKDGLKLSFPGFLKFKDVDEGYAFDPQTNTIVLKGDLPEQILLPIDRVTVTPKLNEETGKYYAGGEIRIEGTVGVAAGKVSGKDVEQIASSSAKVSSTVPEIVADEILFDHFEVGMEESFDFTILKAGDLPKEVKKISRVDLADVDAVIDVTIDNLPDLGVEPSVNFVITMPEELVLDPEDTRVEGNSVKFTGKIKDGRLDIAPIGIEAIDLSAYDVDSEEGLIGHVAIDGGIEAENPELDLASLEGDIRIGLSAAIKDIVIEKVKANVAYDIDGINQTMSLEGLPSFMKGEGFVLDLANPHIVLRTKTNIGIPVSGELLINPIIDGKVNTDGQIKASVTLPSSESASDVKEVAFWFGGDQKACPADYTFINADINKLIRNLPDQLELSLTAGTEADRECVLEPSADYILDVEYDFIVPLEFGDDLHIEISDTLDGLPDILGQLLEKNTVQLSGSITSSLPLALEMKIDMLDLNDKVIPVEKDAVQTISPCNSNGEAVQTPLGLALAVKKGASVTGLSSLKLTFTVTSPNPTGIPVDENDFVQADLKLTLPDGFTMDIADVMNSDENR